MRFIKIFVIISLQFFAPWSYAQTDALRNHICKFINTKKADVGVAVYGIESNDTLTIGNAKHYPMQSVYKFHLALAVLDQVDKGKLDLKQQRLIRKSELIPNTWSPLREKYPEGNVKITASEILTYTVSQSDNIGCDILFKLVGGTEKVNTYIHKLGIEDVSIKTTEVEMHSGWDVQFSNWTTPFATVDLLKKFYTQSILSKKSFDFLWEALVETSTGPNRIKGLLPPETVVAHKTGTSDTNEQGITAAVNDVGIVQLPNGNHVAIAIFVSNSKESDETNNKIIAEVAKMVWDYFVGK